MSAKLEARVAELEREVAAIEKRGAARALLLAKTFDSIGTWINNLANGPVEETIDELREAFLENEVLGEKADSLDDKAAPPT